MDTPRPVQPVGLVSLPRLASALSAAGLTVIGGGEPLRQAVPAIRDARATYGYFPILAADNDETGLGVYLNNAANSGAQVVIAHIDGEAPVVDVPRAKRVPMPCLLADLISALGYPVEGLPQTLREAFVDHDGHVEWNDPAAPPAQVSVPVIADQPNGPQYTVTPVPHEAVRPPQPAHSDADYDPDRTRVRPAFRADEPLGAPTAHTYEPPKAPWELERPAIVDQPVEPAPAHQPPQPVEPTYTPTPPTPPVQQTPPPQPVHQQPNTPPGPPPGYRPPAPSHPAPQAYPPAPSAPVQHQAPAPSPVIQPSHPAQPDPNIGVYGQRPEQALNVSEMFDTAPKGSNHGCDVIVVWSGKGGVGKTSISASLAEKAAMTGRKVILIDSNYGQGGQRIIIGLPKEHPSIYDVAIDARSTGQARIKTGLLTPSQIRNLRGDQPKEVHYALLAAPPPQHADLDITTPSLYLEMVEQARSMADLVVIDTQIVEADTTDAMVAGFLTPLLRNGDTWQVALSDESREGIANLFHLLARFRDIGVRSNRCLSLFNRVPRAAQFNEGAIERALATYGTYIGSVGMDNTIHRSMNAGQPVADNPVLAPILDAILQRVTGDKRFNSHETYTPQVTPAARTKTPWWKKFGGGK